MPLPEDLELQTPQQKDWPILPADVYQTEITDIEYKEIDNRWKKEPTDPDKKQVMNFEFTIIEEGEHYGRKLWQMMAPTKPLPPKASGKASWIWRIASALAGHALTYEEGEKYTTSDVNGFIHRQIRMTVTQSEPKADGKQYNNIESFVAVKQQLPPFDPEKVKSDEKPNEPEAPKQPPTGYEKFKSVANNLPGTNSASAGQNEALVGAEEDGEVDPDSIPF
jgi:hypothetical protein